MSKLIYVPLEDLPARYTQMMNESIYQYANIVLYPDVEIDDQIKRGQFLDIVNTCKFKAAQLQMISDLFNENKVQSGDVFLIGDIFFPGIEMIRYMSELLGIKVRIYGINYAGRADRNDFVQNLSSWADASELGYHQICDGIFVGSKHHKHNVVKYFKIPEEKVHVTGLVWDLDYMDKFTESLNLRDIPKEDFVIWPHRWCAEKGIDELLEFANNTMKKILITSSGPKNTSIEGKLPENVEYVYGLSKGEYYTLMAKARWYLSTAYQETFGYTIQEAIYFKCNILVPDRACCPEMVPSKNVYKKVEDIDKLFDTLDLTVPHIFTSRWDKNIDTMIDITYGGSLTHN